MASKKTASKKTAGRKAAVKKRPATKRAAVWDRPAPKKAKHTHLSPAKKKSAKAAAKRAGRPYPNLVDNLHAAQGNKSS